MNGPGVGATLGYERASRGPITEGGAGAAFPPPNGGAAPGGAEMLGKMA